VITSTTQAGTTVLTELSPPGSSSSEEPDTDKWVFILLFLLVGFGFVRVRRRSMKGSADLDTLPVAETGPTPAVGTEPVALDAAAPVPGSDDDEFDVLCRALGTIVPHDPEVQAVHGTVGAEVTAAMLAPAAIEITEDDDDFHTVTMESNHSPHKPIEEVAAVVIPSASAPPAGLVERIALKDPDEATTLTSRSRSNSYSNVVDASTADVDVGRNRSNSFSRLLDPTGNAASALVGVAEDNGISMDIAPTLTATPSTARMVRSISYENALDTTAQEAQEPANAFSVINVPAEDTFDTMASKNFLGESASVNYSVEESTGALRLKSVRRENPLVKMGLSKANRGIQVLELGDELDALESPSFESGSVPRGGPVGGVMPLSTGRSIRHAKSGTTPDDIEATRVRSVHGVAYEAQRAELAAADDVDVDNEEYYAVGGAASGTQFANDEEYLPVDDGADGQNWAARSEQGSGDALHATPALTPDFIADRGQNDFAAPTDGGWLSQKDPSDSLLRPQESHDAYLACPAERRIDAARKGYQNDVESDEYLGVAGAHSEALSTRMVEQGYPQEEYLALDGQGGVGGLSRSLPLFDNDDEYLGLEGSNPGISRGLRVPQEDMDAEYLGVAGTSDHDVHTARMIQQGDSGAGGPPQALVPGGWRSRAVLDLDNDDEYLVAEGSGDSTGRARPMSQDDLEYLGFDGSEHSVSMARQVSQESVEGYLAFDESKASSGWRSRAIPQFEDDEYLMAGALHSDVHSAKKVAQGGEEYLAVDDSTAKMVEQGGEEYLAMDGPTTLKFENDDEYLGVSGAMAPSARAKARQNTGSAMHFDDDEEYMMTDGTQWGTHLAREIAQLDDDEEYVAVSPGLTRQRDAEALSARNRPQPPSMAREARPEVVHVDCAKSVRNVGDPTIAFLDTIAAHPGFTMEARTSMILPEESSHQIHDEVPQWATKLPAHALGGSRARGSMDRSSSAAMLPNRMNMAGVEDRRRTASDPQSTVVRRRTTAEADAPASEGTDDWRLSMVARAFEDDDEDVAPMSSISEEGAGGDAATLQPDITQEMFRPTAGHRGAAYRTSGRRFGNRLANVFGKKKRRSRGVPPPPASGGLVAMTDRNSTSSEDGEPTRRALSRQSPVRSRPPSVAASSPDGENVFVPVTNRRSVMLTSSVRGVRSPAGVDREDIV